MRKIARVRAAAAAAALALSGCATTEPVPLPGEVRIVAVERRFWDAPEEPHLFRLQFDATRAREIARRAAILSGSRFDGDLRSAEFAALEEDAEREMRAKGKCDGLARLATPVRLGDGSAGVTAIFKCVPPVF